MMRGIRDSVSMKKRKCLVMEYFIARIFPTMVLVQVFAMCISLGIVIIEVARIMYASAYSRKLWSVKAM